MGRPFRPTRRAHTAIGNAHLRILQRRRFLQLCAAMSDEGSMDEATEAVTTQPKAKRAEVMAYVRDLDPSQVLGA